MRPPTQEFDPRLVQNDEEFVFASACDARQQLASPPGTPCSRSQLAPQGDCTDVLQLYERGLAIHGPVRESPTFTFEAFELITQPPRHFFWRLRKEPLTLLRFSP